MTKIYSDKPPKPQTPPPKQTPPPRPVAPPTTVPLADPAPTRAKPVPSRPLPPKK